MLVVLAIIYETASHGLNKSAKKKFMITHKKHPYNKVARIQTAGEVLWLVKSTPTYFRTAQLLVNVLLDYLLLVNIQYSCKHRRRKLKDYCGWAVAGLQARVHEVDQGS